ncbi:putative phage holin [Nocardioides terrisoli]|uniref:putative phage holin n=1 Tax=Nocardioides terrisoli TaxID=3388267 RepID=UPI00287B727A|nr:hypothetical protein [Nocardioides marmorisolisilvae]
MRTVALWIIVAAAPAATAVPIVYAATARWWRSLIGRAMMTSAVGLALLVDLSLIFHGWSGHLGVKEAIALVVYGIVACGAWLTLFALARTQVLQRREDRAAVEAGE